jgi:hypothetical protein
MTVSKRCKHNIILHREISRELYNTLPQTSKNVNAIFYHVNLLHLTVAIKANEIDRMTN